MYNCRLKIESRYKKITLEEGLSLQELGEILVKLSKCLEVKNVKFIITGIEHKSYTPIVSTEKEEDAKKFNLIHSDIFSLPFDELSFDEKNYASALNKILFERGLFLTVNNQIDEADIVLKDINKSKSKNYNTVTTINAKIVIVNGRDEARPYITIKASNNTIYKLSVNPEQEKSLSGYYKDSTIRFRVRLKSNASFPVESTEVSGKLLDFSIPSKKVFTESLIEVKNKYQSLFSNIADSAKLLNELRNLSSHD